MPNRPFRTLNSGIKRPVIFLVALLLTQSTAVGGEFTRTLTPEKMRAAGLAKLTPEVFFHRTSPLLQAHDRFGHKV